jgi:hypothetical protein
MGFKYRLCFEFIGKSAFTDGGNEVEFTVPGLELPIKLAAVGPDKDLSSDSRISISSGPFEDMREAELQSRRAKDCLLYYGLTKRTGIDVGLYSYSAVLTDAGRKRLSDETDKPVLQDDLGITIFEVPPHPVFFAIRFDGKARYNTDYFIDFFKKHYGRPKFKDANLEFAAELYSLSFKSGNPRARFAILFMCLDLIITRKKRDQEVQDHIGELVSATNGSKLLNSHKTQLLGGLNSLRTESLHAAAMRYAHELDSSLAINGQTPPDFFRFVRRFRNKVIHGSSVDGQLLKTATEGMAQFVNAVLIMRIGL